MPGKVQEYLAGVKGKTFSIINGIEDRISEKVRRFFEENTLPVSAYGVGTHWRGIPYIYGSEDCKEVLFFRPNLKESSCDHGNKNCLRLAALLMVGCMFVGCASGGTYVVPYLVDGYYSNADDYCSNYSMA